MELEVGKILGLSDQLNYLGNIFGYLKKPSSWLDILIVAALIYWFYLLLKETRAIRILYGILILAVIMLLGRFLHLSVLNFILKYFVTMIVVAIPIVFQPELRAALERLGRTKFVGEFHFLPKTEIEEIINKIIEAVKVLSREKLGALIVLARQTGLKDVIETGVEIEGTLSTPLILNLFSPNSPLHDGAIIISGKKILAANCMLPLSDLKTDYSLGTRHRAAIGLTSQTDAIVIIISEERGTISLALNGVLTQDITPDRVGELLTSLLPSKPIFKEKRVQISSK